ncbi:MULTISPECIES: hypothetical protein [Kribbella]|uniref:Uncharacterized protein n=1 Tax=Kribbella karoonensis TaxID=324851 RepID=A0ABP4PYX2_9ACTN
MITEHAEVARYRVAEQLRAAEVRAQRRERKPRTGARESLAVALRRLADKLEPTSRRLTEPATRPLTDANPHRRGTGLSIVR